MIYVYNMKHNYFTAKAERNLSDRLQQGCDETGLWSDGILALEIRYARIFLPLEKMYC